MDPALLKHAPQIGFSPMHATYYDRLRGDRRVPFGAVHDTFFARRRGQNWIPYGAMGHSQVHSTFHSRLRGQNWIPYGDFVYKPVSEGGLEVMPEAESQAYGRYGQDAGANGYTLTNVVMAAVIGVMVGQLAGEQLERLGQAKGWYRGGQQRG
ncbi:MAG: hypothetical protein Q8Q14_09185 [Gemmatimonadales bacterium]|nr:hypothetical protein [Gemmatimonadales bacterium]